MTAPGLSRDERVRLARAMFEADCALGVTDCETWAELRAKGWDAGYDEAAGSLVAELAKVGLAVWSAPADAVPALHEIEIAAARAANPDRGQMIADCLAWLRSEPLQESLVTTSLVDYLLALGYNRAGVTLSADDALRERIRELVQQVAASSAEQIEATLRSWRSTEADNLDYDTLQDSEIRSIAAHLAALAPRRGT